MLKHILAGTAAVAALALVAPAMALDNPWENDGDTVNVEIVVGSIGEVYSTVGSGQARQGNPALALEITNAGGIIPPTGIAEDTVNHLANVNYQVSVELDGDIGEFTRFHVLFGINNRGAYDSVGGGSIDASAVQADADMTITWDRRDAGTGYLGNQPGTPVPAVSGTPTMSAVASDVDYAADAIHGLPSTGNTPFDVVYTIAQN